MDGKKCNNCTLSFWSLSKVLNTISPASQPSFIWNKVLNSSITSGVALQLYSISSGSQIEFATVLKKSLKILKIVGFVYKSCSWKDWRKSVVKPGRIWSPVHLFRLWQGLFCYTFWTPIRNAQISNYHILRWTNSKKYIDLE